MDARHKFGYDERVAFPNIVRSTFVPMAPDPAPHYIAHAGLRGASGAIFSGPYRSPRELSLTGLVGSDIWRPPTYVGNPGSSAPTAIAAPHFCHLKICVVGHGLTMDGTRPSDSSVAPLALGCAAFGLVMRAVQPTDGNLPLLLAARQPLRCGLKTRRMEFAFRNFSQAYWQARWFRGKENKG